MFLKPLKLFHLVRTLNKVFLQLLPRGNVALEEVLRAREDSHQGGLSAAVSSDEGDALPLAENEVLVVDEDILRDLEVDACCQEHHGIGVIRVH